MLTFTTSETHPLEIQVKLRRPALYLDSCVISDLAGTQKGERLRKLICGTGTLYISWAHLVEVFRIGQGPTFERISAYLKAFGPHFIIIDSDTNAVARREREWKWGRQNPAIDEEFLRRLPGYWDGKTEMSLGILLDGMGKEDGVFEGIKQLHSRYKFNLKRLFDEQRRRYGTDKQRKRILNRADYSAMSAHLLATRIQLELLRETVRTHETFNESDALDFSHAVIGIAYCDYAVLDKKWARRCRKVDLPRAAATVYDGTEIDRLLAACENWKA